MGRIKKELITVSFATYNVDKYIAKALETITTQTYSEIEILVIDDGSSDNTLRIIKQYANIDSRIRLLENDKNMGLAVARNIAFLNSRGKYIAFLDGDDLFALDMVEKAYNKITETDADFVMWDYCTFYDEKDLPKLLKSSSGLIGFDSTDKEELLKRPAFIWVKMFKTDFLRKLNIHFPEGLTKQDIPVWWKVVTATDKIAILPERLSYYRQQPGATSRRRDKSVFSLAYVMDIVKEQLESDGIYEIYKEIFLAQKLGRLYGMYDLIEPNLKIEAKQILQRRIGVDELSYLKSSNNLSFRTKLFYKKIMGNLIAGFLYNSFIVLRSVYRFIKQTYE